MSTNNSSQTLFRFVSLRNPQLTETKETNKGFIFRPDYCHSEPPYKYFDSKIENMVSGEKKWQVLVKAAAEIKNDSAAKTEIFKKENDLTTPFENFLKLGEAISKKETSKMISISSPLSQGEESKIWLNLIYQVITQESFYIKEKLFQILKANHYIKATSASDNTTASLQDGNQPEVQLDLEILLDAKVVLPVKLFSDAYPNTDDEVVNRAFQVNVSDISRGIINLQEEVQTFSPAYSKKRPLTQEEINNSSVARAKTDIEHLKSTSKQIDKLEKAYKKRYQKAYEDALKQHQTEIKPALDAYQAALLRVEADFTEETTEAQKQLARLQVPKPEVPEFTFSFENEVDTEMLSKKLSSKELSVLAEVIAEKGLSKEEADRLESRTLQWGNKMAALPEDEYQTYEEIRTALESKVAELQEFVYQNTEIEREEFVSVGGVLLPVSKTIPFGKSSSSIPCTLKIQKTRTEWVDSGGGQTQTFTAPDGGGTFEWWHEWDLQVDLTGTGLKVASVSYKLFTDDGEEQDTQYSSISNKGEKYTINTLFGMEYLEAEINCYKKFSATITLSDGREIYGEILPDFQFFEGGYAYDGAFAFTNTDGGGDNPNPETPNLFALQYRAEPKLASGTNYNIDLTLELPDSETWQVSKLNYTLKSTPKASISNSVYTMGPNTDTNTIDFRALFGNGLDIAYYNATTVLDVDVTFTNNKRVVFTTGILSLSAPTIGSFTVTNTSTNSTGGDNTGSTDIPNSFIPKGFGFRNVGVADYLKVEQSLVKYIAGDVAHIENIMAREYKERTTEKSYKSEVTDTTSTETEREQLTDTTTTTRFDMQSEIAKMMNDATDTSAHLGVQNKIGFGKHEIMIDAGAQYANHKSKEESTRQAVTQSQDITNRALDRIVSKVKKERITKITEEYRETNKHGFDNKNGKQHAVGVFRWVDKLMNNQIYNYGSRMMFEFMVPEPAKIHTLGMTSIQAKSTLVKPIDPRAAGEFQLKDYTDISNENKLKHWLREYNVELDEKLDDTKSISHSFSANNLGIDDNGYGRWTGTYSNNDFKIPENYEAIKILGGINVGGGVYKTGVNVWSYTQICGVGVGSSIDLTFAKPIRGNISISLVSWDVKGISGSLVANCQLTQEAKTAWAQKAFNTIIQAYEDAMREYQSKVDAENANAVQIKGSNSGFYRQIENMALRKNCISYMMDRSNGATFQYGKDFLQNAASFTTEEVSLSDTFDQYTAFVKFMEQAFEWDNISYNLYPYYWSGKDRWADMYQKDEVDPLFRSFLQAGMARVIVTVRPGFEDAVQFYLATGKIWNGGEVPVIGDPLYLSLVDELRAPKGKPQGKSWMTKLPTSLNILQAQSIGLEVAEALPDYSQYLDLANVENASEYHIGVKEFSNNGSFSNTAQADGQITNIEVTAEDFELTNADEEVVAKIPLKTLKDSLDSVS